MNRRKTAHAVEALESRIVPTMLLGQPIASFATTMITDHQAPPTHNDGTIHGTFGVSTGPGGVDAGMTDTFAGRGNLDFLGSVHLSGSVTGTGNIALGHANGEITLTSARGSVTLELVGQEQGMFAYLPQQFQFSTIKATGAFTDFQLTGTVHLIQRPNAKTFWMTFESLQISKSTLAGKGVGDYTVAFPLPDVGSVYSLDGIASLGLLGHVNLSGSIRSTGSIDSGTATGELTLTNGQGSVTLQLTGPIQPGFAPLPKQFGFTILSATGAYNGLQITGSIDLAIKSSSVERGTFSLAIHPNAS